MIKRWLEVLRVSTILGLTSFGGPVAHLGYFHEAYVKRRKWLDEKSYADLVALCQFLPGPASSQVGIAIGIQRAGLVGGLLAWLGFTLPSAMVLMMFAAFLHQDSVTTPGWLHGLLLVAVAVVAQAVWGMATKLAIGRLKGAMAISSALIILVLPTSYTQILILILAGVVGWVFFRTKTVPSVEPLRMNISRKTGLVFLSLFFLFLVALPILASRSSAVWLTLVDRFYRAGALVFGGGHVVLPLLQKDVVPIGWMTNSQFLAGYGATQAVPGPLFTFSAYLGFVADTPLHGLLGGSLALIAIFLPAYFLVAGVMPFWNVVRTQPSFQAILAGINASVVGILLAALYNPVWTSAVHTNVDFGLALVDFGLLVVAKLPPWVVVLFSALAGWGLSAYV